MILRAVAIDREGHSFDTNACCSADFLLELQSLWYDCSFIILTDTDLQILKPNFGRLRETIRQRTAVRRARVAILNGG